MIEKIYRKFCAEQVNILLDRMDSNPEEFVGVTMKWGAFLPGGDGFDSLTVLEQRLVRRKMRAINNTHKRQRALNGIIERLAGNDESEGKLIDHNTLRISTVSRYTPVPDRATIDEIKKNMRKELEEELKATQRRAFYDTYSRL